MATPEVSWTLNLAGEDELRPSQPGERVIVVNDFVERPKFGGPIHGLDQVRSAVEADGGMVVRADIRKLPFPDEVVSAVFARRAIASDRPTVAPEVGAAVGQTLVEEWARVLKPGGSAKLHFKPDHVDAEQLASVMDEVGFVEVRHTTQTETVDMYDREAEELDLVYTEGIKPPGTD